MTTQEDRAMSWLGRLCCAMGLHRWGWHPIVRDWYCDRCRIRKPDLGVRR